ncbi:lysosome membrane protein 2-like [Saccoglossus kowalevskii]
MTNPDNIGFCSPDVVHCLPSGLLNSAPCHYGFPLVMSSPHFLNADSSVMLPGMKPKKKDHATYLDIHMETGITMQTAKRMQINIHLKKNKKFPQFSEIEDVFYPVLWFSENYVISDTHAAKFNSVIGRPLYMYHLTQLLVIGLGVPVLCVKAIVLGVERINLRQLQVS